MYYLENRYYDSEIKRFICADKINSVKASMETLHNENLYSYCDNNPISRRDESGDIWGAALIGFAIGAATSVASQVILDKKTLNSINYVNVITTGISTSLSVIGVPGKLQTGLNLVLDFVSNIAEGNSVVDSVVNAAISTGVSHAFSNNFDYDANYLQCTIKYKKVQKKILNENFDPIEAIPHFIREAKKYDKNMKQIYKVNAQSNLAISTYTKVATTRVIGYGRRYNPKTGVKETYMIYA